MDHATASLPLLGSAKSKKAKITPFLVALLAITFSLLVLAIIGLVKDVDANNGLSKRKPTAVDDIISNIISKSIDFSLPTRFSVDSSYIVPPTDQMQRGTCWDFATMFLLESQYRHQGIKQGFLHANDYISFSKQAYGAFIGQSCLKNSSVAPCKHGGFPQNITDDHKIDSIYYFAKAFPTLTSSILPEAVCPYTNETSNITDFKCDGMDEAITTNPIQFKIVSIEAASDVKTAKKLMIKSQRPLGVGLPLGQMRFYGPCDGSFANFTDCQNKKYLCPDGFPSTYCAAIDIEGRAPDGTLVYVDDYDRTAHLGGHAVDIVGYNDDWVYRSRLAAEKSLSALRGGFILHNSWTGLRGHSVDYLMGRRSDENEAVVCPNHRMSMNWVPATLDCMQKNGSDYTKCGTSIRRVRGKGLTMHADLLKCKNTHFCNTTRKYVLAASPLTAVSPDVHVSHLFNGMDRTEFISWTNESDARSEFIDTYPFPYLHDIFVPSEIVENSYDDCGYYIVPYASIEMQKRKTWSLIDTFHVVDINVEFTKSSYTMSADTKYNYTLLKRSTRNFTTLQFDGPLPYEYVY